jgi:uncharacterized protein (DUF58 family)
MGVTATGPGPSTYRFRSTAPVLVAAAAVLGAAGIVLRNPLLLFLALPLLIAPAAGLALLPPGRAPARLAWGVTGGGPAVELVGYLGFASAGEVRAATVRVERPASLTEARPPEVERAGRTLTFRDHWTAAHPMLALVPLPLVGLADPLGLVERVVPVEGTPRPVERFPAEALRLGTVRLRRTTPIPGEVRARGIGPGSEFFQVRPALPGDSLRDLNWKATARAGRLLVNDRFLDRTGDLLLVLDCRPTPLPAAVDAELLEVAAAAALGIASGFLRQKSRVGLALYGEFVTPIPLGTGATHRLRLAQALASVRIGPVAGPPERLAVALGRYYPVGLSTLVLTSLAEGAPEHLLPYLRRRGYPASVLSPSPLPLLARSLDPQDASDRLVERLARQVRRRSIRESWDDGPVLDWEEYWDLGALPALLRPTARIRGFG